LILMRNLNLFKKILGILFSHWDSRKRPKNFMKW
jgi:hypothetical protein